MDNVVWREMDNVASELTALLGLGDLARIEGDLTSAHANYAEALRVKAVVAYSRTGTSRVRSVAFCPERRYSLAPRERLAGAARAR
jgi:hypothetical protein